MTDKELLKIDNISVSYGNIKALRGVSMSVNEGEIVSLIGANGAGKSTLLKAIVGQVPLLEGSIICIASAGVDMFHILEKVFILNGKLNNLSLYLANGELVYLLKGTIELTKSHTCLFEVWKMSAPYLCTLIPSTFSQYIFPPKCSRLSITRHFLPCFLSLYAIIDP